MFVIIDGRGKRVRLKGELTPCFEYRIQACKFIDKHINSPYVKVHEVGGKANDK